MQVELILSDDDSLSSDVLDDFNKLLVKQSSEVIRKLEKELLPVVESIKTMLGNLAAKDSKYDKLSGIVTTPLSKQVDNWEFQPELEDLFISNLGITTSDLTPSDFEIAVSEHPIRQYPKLSELWATSDDPVVLGGMLASILNIEPETVYLIKRFDAESSLVKLDIEVGKKAVKFFKSKSGKSAAARYADGLEDQSLLLMVSKDKVLSPYGLSYPKFFSVACSPDWKHYGSEYLRQVPREAGLSSKRIVTSKSIVQSAQRKHNHVVKTLLEKLETVPEFISHLSLVSRTTGDMSVINMMFRGLDDDPKNVTQSFLSHYLSQLRSLSQTICQTSPVKHSMYMFRIAQTTDGTRLAFISTSKSIERITDLAYAYWCVPCRLSDMPLRTRTVSSRKLVWWHKLPGAFMLKSASYAQLNMSVASKGRYYTNEDLVEYMSFHLDTRQQDSLLFGQTRPTFAASMSPLPSKEGSINKLKGIHLKGSASIIYFARLVHSHCNMYLRKAGMRPKLDLSKDVSPAIVFPSALKPPLNMNEFVDSLFESRVFNKIKDNSLSSDALDWLALIENEVAYQKEKKENTLDKLGMSPECLSLVKKCVDLKSVDVLFADLASAESVFKESAISWWTQTGHVDGSGFSWNAAAMYSIAITKTSGRRFVGMSNDYSSPMATLYDTPISKFLSGSGATLGTQPSADSQSCRKPTAILELVAQLFGPTNDPKRLGPIIQAETEAFMDRNLNTLGLSLWVMTNRGSMRLISRTVDKDQAEGWREFSPMNSVGIIMCRATEIPMSVIAPQYPIDLMNDPHAEETLCNTVSKLGDSTCLYMAADCSRFGPKQEMSSLRCMIMALCLSSDQEDVIEQSVYYDLLSESTRLMGNKITKMPSRLYTFFKEQGGYMKTYQHNKDSVYGKISSLSMYELQNSFVEPYFTQEWGMLQGTISMASSLKSSLIHEIICDIARDTLSDDAKALVTNDDSLLILVNIKRDMPIDNLSLYLQSLLKYGLALAAQKLNPFKTIVSTLIAEFHSMFAVPEGLIVPQFKMMLASLDVGTGDSISEDMRIPIKSAITAIRHGCTMFSALSLAHVMQMYICSQHSRLRWLKDNNAGGLSILGQPQNLDLIGELYIPNASDLAKLSEVSDDGSHVIASQQYALDLEEVLQYKSAHVTKVSRIAFRESRALSETNWFKKDLSLPMTTRTNMASLHAAINNGVYSNRFDKSKDHYLVRLAKGLSSTSKQNVILPEGSFLRRILGDKSSVDDMSKVPLTDLIHQAKKYSETNPYTQSVVRYINLFVPIIRSLRNAPKISECRLLKSLRPTDFHTSKTALVKASIPTNKYSGFEALSALYGSDELIRKMQEERRGVYLPLSEGLVKESSEIKAAGALVTRMSKHSQGGFFVHSKEQNVMSTKELVLSIVKNYVPNVSLDTSKLLPVLDKAEEFIPSKFEVAPSMLLGTISSSAGTEELIETKHQLYDYLRLSDKGWYSFPGNVFIKVAKARPVKGYRISDTYIVTVKVNREYVHTFISNEDIIHLGMIENIKEFRQLTVALRKGGVYRAEARDWRSITDIYKYVDTTTYLPLILMESDGGRYLHGRDLIIPISREPWSHGQNPVVSSETFGTWEDVVVVLSMENIGYESSRMKYLEQYTDVDRLALFRAISEEFHTQDNYVALRQNQYFVYNRKKDSKFLESEQRAAWYMSNHDFDSDNAQELLFDFFSSDSNEGDVEVDAEQVYHDSEDEYVVLESMAEVLTSLTETGFFGSKDLLLLHNDLRTLE
jgi:hypothetical protein